MIIIINNYYYISQYCCFFCLFDQINTALVDTFKSLSDCKLLNVNMCVYTVLTCAVPLPDQALRWPDTHPCDHETVLRHDLQLSTLERVNAKIIYGLNYL